MKICILFIFLLTLSCSKPVSHHLSETPVLEPELFLPGIVSTPEHSEFSMTISPIDAKTIFFTRRVGDGKQKIYETTYHNGTWSVPKIASFSTDRDESPAFSRDGKTLYFGSERPVPNQPNLGNFDMNIWKTTIDNNGLWSQPEVLPPTINEVQIAGEEWPSSNMSHFMTVDDTLFYTGTLVRNDKGLDIYSTTYKNGQFSVLTKLPETINSVDTWEYAPVISYDGKYLFFQVYKRKDGLGGDDIFVSKKDENGQWLPSKNLGQLVNTTLNECPIALTSDNKYFFFSRALKSNPEDLDGIASLFFIETEALQLEELFK